MQTILSLATGPGRVPKRHLPSMLDEARIVQMDKNASTSSRTASQHPRRAQATGRAPSRDGRAREQAHLTHKAWDPGFPHSTAQPSPAHTMLLQIELLACCVNHSLSGCDKHRQVPQHRPWCYPCSSQSQPDISRESRHLSDLNT